LAVFVTPLDSPKKNGWATTKVLGSWQHRYGLPDLHVSAQSGDTDHDHFLGALQLAFAALPALARRIVPLSPTITV
jgi:hypothetical protein